MHKRKLHHTLRLIKKIPVTVLIAAFIFSGVFSLVSLRQNNVKAIELRDAVTAADMSGGDVDAALFDLRTHVYSHMNSSLATDGGVYPPVQLKYRYERLVTAEKDRVSAQNAQLYTQAQADCEARIPSGRTIGRVECIQSFITSRGGAVEQPIPDALYKFDFAAPAWSPDRAGWSIVVTFVLFVLLVTRILSAAIIKHELKRHI